MLSAAERTVFQLGRATHLAVGRRQLSARRLSRAIVLCCMLSIAATACASPSPTSPSTAPDTAPKPDGIHAVPLLEFDGATTWDDLLNAVADTEELDCINKTIDDEDLPEDFLSIEIIDPVSGGVFWPVWVRQVVGVEVGSDHWPNKVWECLAPQTAAAVYVSVSTAELTLLRSLIDESAKACLTELATDPDLSEAVADVLTSTTSFDDETLDGFFMELDEEVVFPEILPCILTTPDDVGASDAVPLIIGETLIAGFDSDAETDLYVVEVPDELDGMNLVVGTRGSLDTVLSVYSAPEDAEPQFMCRSDDVGEDLNAAISLPLPAGTYLFEISSWWGDTGNYEVYSAVAGDSESPSVESQQEVLGQPDKKDAVPLIIGETLIAGFDSDAETDLYVVEVPDELDGMNLVVGTRGSLDTVLSVYSAPEDAEPQFMCQVDDVGEDLNAAISLPLPAGTYLFEISSWWFEADEVYEVYVDAS